MHTTPIDLYIFSGTGNTLLAAQEFARYFREQNIDIRLHRLEKADPAAIDPKRTLGLAFPVAASSTYPFVWKFVEGLPQAAGTDVFMFDTLAAYSGGIKAPLRNALVKKGYRPLGACEIVMPSNLISPPKSEQKKQSKLAKGKKKAYIFAHDIHHGLAKWSDLPVLPGLLNKMGRSEKPWESMRKSFKFTIDTDKCIQCGICYKLCPADNIRMYEFPEMLDHCETCLRCINFCPVQAITSASKRFKLYQSVKADDLLHPDKAARAETDA